MSRLGKGHPQLLQLQRLGSGQLSRATSNRFYNLWLHVLELRLPYGVHILGIYPRIPQDNSSSLDYRPRYNQPRKRWCNVRRLRLDLGFCGVFTKRKVKQSKKREGAKNVYPRVHFILFTHHKSLHTSGIQKNRVNGDTKHTCEMANFRISDGP